MNLFVIPSWYPCQLTPLSGIFVQEQAEAIAAQCPDTRVIVSKWGHNSGHIPIRRPWMAAKVLYWRSSQQRDLTLQSNGVWEVSNPAITWSHRLPLGGARRLVGVNRRNFELAKRQFGDIDIIHAHVGYPAGYIASILASEFGVPYVLTEHMSPFPFPSLLRHGKPVPEIDRAYKWASATIAVSPSLAKCIAETGYSEPKVIPNMVDECRFTPGSSKSGKFTFFTLCGLNSQKGIDNLLDAIALWNPDPARFEFRIGGDGPMREAYEDKSRELRIDDRIDWLGPVSRDDAPGLFRDCNVFVLPSRHETFGIVYAEAIASGKPIIATRCGGPEFIVNEVNGQLIDVEDIPGLAGAMQSIADRWSDFSPTAIRSDFESRFSSRAVVSQLSALYEATIGA